MVYGIPDKGYGLVLQSEKDAAPRADTVSKPGCGRYGPVWPDALLDNVIQTTIMDEFVYHEMITHVAQHPRGPEKSPVIGAATGAVREIVKHPSIEKVVHCEIDGAVIEASRKYLPRLLVPSMIPGGNSRGRRDQARQEQQNIYDVIIVDSTDPVGPAEGFFRILLQRYL